SGDGLGGLLDLEHVEERALEGAAVELAPDAAAHHEGDDARLLGHDHGQRARVLGDADGGAIAAAQLAAELRAHGEGQEAGAVRPSWASTFRISDWNTTMMPNTR